MLMNYLAKFLSVHVQKINENILVQLMSGFGRITKDNKHLLKLHAVMVLSKRSSYNYDLWHRPQTSNLSAKCHFNIYFLCNKILIKFKLNKITEFYFKVLLFPSVLLCLLSRYCFFNLDKEELNIAHDSSCSVKRKCEMSSYSLVQGYHQVHDWSSNHI